MQLFDYMLDRFVQTTVGNWMVTHTPPKWIAPTLSLISILLSVSAMVLATRAR